MKRLAFAVAAIVTSLAAPLLSQSDAPSPSQTSSSGYDQVYRPQVHFSPQKNWTNDPNGLVYFEGEYHLFFQHDPTSISGGHMSWGHAVSTDLVHWQELPVAIPADERGMIFTGSTVVDTNNTSGFCSSGHACLVAVYTVHAQTSKGIRETQQLSYSNDRGRTWSRYDKNPVIDLDMTDFRDPSVSWNTTLKQWVMAVALPNNHKVRFYASPDLKEWKLQGEFGPAGNDKGQWECPDLVQIPPDSKASGTDQLWALKVGINPNALQGGSGEQYFLGSFNGSSFTPLTDPTAHGWTNYGKDDYCAISYNGLPAGSKPLLVGWMSDWQYAGDQPTSPWRGQFSLPRRLTYIHDRAGYALRQQPVVEGLRIGTPSTISSKQATPIAASAPYELNLAFPQSTTQSAGIRLRSDADHYTEIGFDAGHQRFYIDRTHSGLNPNKDFPARTETAIVSDRPWTLTLIVDRASVEAYAQDGTIAMTDLIFPPSPKATIEFLPTPDKAIGGKLWRLKSIWPGAAR